MAKKPAQKKKTIRITVKGAAKNKAKAPAKPQKSVNAKDNLKQLLIKELKTNIPRLDEEGLSFLVEQSRIHLYNMQVEKLNNARIAAVSAINARRKTTTKKTTNEKPVKEVINIKPTGAGFCLYCCGSNTMFSKQEMTQLVKIAHGPGSEPEAGERIFAWLTRERSDVINTLKLRGKGDVKLALIAEVLRKNFTLRN